MKLGFQINIQSDLTNAEIKIAKNTSDNFIIRTLSDVKKRYGGQQSYGGRDTPYSRGSCLSLGNGLYFMRINRHKRIFGVLRNTPEEKILPPMFTYAVIGDIKG